MTSLTLVLETEITIPTSQDCENEWHGIFIQHSALCAGHRSRHWVLRWAALGSSHGAGRPHEDEDSFLPLSFLETHGTGLSSSFTSPLSCPLKFSSIYASHNLLWEVIYFFFHSWCHFHSYIWGGSSVSPLSVTKNKNDWIFPTEWMFWGIGSRFGSDILPLKMCWKLWILGLAKW